MTSAVIYQAEVTNNMNDEKMFYIGLTSKTFKERYTNHKTSFKHKKYEKEKELSKYIWKLKDLNQVPSIKWSYLKKIRGRASSSFCKLCLMEKLFIIESFDNKSMLNKRNKLISKCRHINRNLLRFYKSDSND